jgi:aminopeptidase YwaD
MLSAVRLSWFSGGLLALALSSFSGTARFQPDSYLQHVKYLASDELKGRGNGTPELERAAEYIAQQFQTAGLQPAGDNGTFFQSFQLTTGSRLGPNNRLTVFAGHQSFEAALRQDFVPIGIGDKTNIRGDVVFAGYGISAAEYNYDDYKNLDVTGKIVLVLAHEPRENDATSAFNGVEPTLYGHDNTKAINAKFRGARALLIVQDPANHTTEAAELPDSGGSQGNDLGICVLRVSPGLARRLLEGDQKNLLDLQTSIDRDLAPQSFVLTGASVSLEVDVFRVRSEVRNVVGLLPGLDPGLADETIVLGAHYDHLGLGGRDSMAPKLVGQIHNGADDNASGSAGVVELARAFSRDHSARKRSYLFIAFAGEELGLHGSAFWTQHPTRPLEKVVAMLNLDMIGRSRGNHITLGGIGTSPRFPDLVKESATESGIDVKTSQSGYGSSDHTSFYVKDIPVLFFFSGLHTDYHRPTDDWEKINASGAIKILEMIYEIAARINTDQLRPQFTKVDEPMTSGSASGGAGGYGSYFGSIPDMTDEIQGVRFADIRSNSPAAKAGLKANDTLVRFAGKEIKNLQDFTYMLRTHKPGELVEVTVMRDGKPLTVEVRLEVRP